MDFISVASSLDHPERQLRRLMETMLGSNDNHTMTTNVTTSSSSSGMKHSPLLSPAAERELFMLATNFLLYVAMVIIVIMVAKIYFPESLQRRGSDFHAPRSYNYRRVNTSNINPSSDDDDDEEDVDLLLHMEKEQEEDEEKHETKKKKKIKKSNSVVMEFDQETTSKTVVLKRLTLCVVMLNITFIIWGLLQERMLTRRYPRYTGEFFHYSYALVFTNRFWTVILSGLLLLYLKPRRSQSTVIYEYSFPSISNMLSSWCQYEALQYVSFPAVTLFKSFKLAPVMAMGKLLGNKKYPQYDYVVALLIGIGLAMFMADTDELQLGYNIHDEFRGGVWTGVMLLFLFLFFDSFTSQWQSRMFQRHRDLSMIELMFATSAFSTILSMITLIHNKELGPALSFMYRHQEIHLHFLVFSICSTIGQLFIFYTIKNFGAVVFTIIMTTRVLLSITLSCFLYEHKVTSMGFLGLMLVLAAVCYRIKRKVQGQQLIKWRGMGDEKAYELVQEWHEHIDM